MYLCYRKRNGMTEWLRRNDLSPTTGLVLLLLGFFFFLFLVYPLSHVFSSAFFTDEGFSLIFFKLMLTNPNYRVILVNSINLGLMVTLLTTLLSLPLALLCGGVHRWDQSPGRTVGRGRQYAGGANCSGGNTGHQQSSKAIQGRTCQMLHTP